MRYAASEKLEIIRTVEDSSLGINRTLGQLDISFHVADHPAGKNAKLPATDHAETTVLPDVPVVDEAAEADDPTGTQEITVT